MTRYNNDKDFGINVPLNMLMNIIYFETGYHYCYYYYIIYSLCLSNISKSLIILIPFRSTSRIPQNLEQVSPKLAPYGHHFQGSLCKDEETAPWVPCSGGLCPCSPGLHEVSL